MHGVMHRNPSKMGFHQAVGEVCESIIPFVLDQSRTLAGSMHRYYFRRFLIT